jgi:uncharacterized membrane protein YeaQ/YmgE (transglycosylase-associated protein family)
LDDVYVWKGRDMEVLGVIVAGIIIGLLGKLVAPGDKDNTPLWATILAGIAGVLIGWYVSAALGVAETAGVDWIISIIVAAILVVATATLMGRNKNSLTR